MAIVGEGIREGVEAMVEYLQGTPQLAFTLALIELACYRVNRDQDWPMVIVPRTVMRTAEVERAIVTVQINPQAPEGVEVDVKLPPKPPKPDGGDKKRITAAEFFTTLTAETDAATSDAVRAWADELNTGNQLLVGFGLSRLAVRLLAPQG